MLSPRCALEDRYLSPDWERTGDPRRAGKLRADIPSLHEVDASTAVELQSPPPPAMRAATLAE